VIIVLLIFHYCILALSKIHIMYWGKQDATEHRKLNNCQAQIWLKENLMN